MPKSPPAPAAAPVSARTARSSGAVLVLESDDLALRGAVIRGVSAGRFSVAAHAESSALGLGSALGEVLRELRAAGVEVPARTIMLSSQVHAMVLDLPVAPERPLPWKQMHEMLRWELEPYMTRSRARRIGAILVGRGFMSATDLERLVREMEGRQPGGGSGAGAGGNGRIGDIRPRRFGELAVEAGYVTREQLDECLNFQQSLPSFEGAPVCGWTPLESPPQNGRWKWLVAGVAEDCRRHMAGTLDRHGLKLAALYPLVGCSAACLDGAAAGRSGAVFEYHGGFLGCVHLSADGRVTESRSAFSHAPGVPADECAGLCDPDAARVWLAGRWPDLEAATAMLSSCLGRSCAVLPVDVELPPGSEHPAAAFAAAGGAAAHFLGREGSRRVAGVPAVDPRPPLVRSVPFWLATASALAAGLLVVAGVGSRMGRLGRDAVIRAGDEAAALRNQVSALEAELGRERTCVEFLERTLPARQALVPSLLQSLEAGWSDEVVIRRIDERPDGRIEIGAWGLTPEGIQAFRIELQRHLRGWRLVDAGKPVRKESGWGNLPGYGFEVTLVAEDGR